MNKKLIRLTESDLHRIVKESVNRILKESTHPRRRINEVSTSLVRRAGVKALGIGKKQQWKRFNDKKPTNSWNSPIKKSLPSSATILTQKKK